MADKKFNAFIDLVPDGGMTAVLRTVGIFGDSLASGEQEYTQEDGSNGYYDDYDLSWGQFMARKCGIKVTNYTRGGLTAQSFQNLALVMRTFYDCNKCKAYIIALGVNDTKRIKEFYGEFGSMEDVDFDNYANNKGTFVGCYVKMIQQIKEVEPYARIFVTTIPKNIQEEEDAKTDGAVAEVKEIRDKHAELLRSLPSYFDRVYVIDLRAQDYYLGTEEFKRKYHLGGHLNSCGYKYFGDVFATYIDHIISENPEEFASVGLIGTEFAHKNHKK